MSTNNQSTHNYRFSYSSISRKKWARAFGRADELRKELKEEEKKELEPDFWAEPITRHKVLESN